MLAGGGRTRLQKLPINQTLLMWVQRDRRVPQNKEFTLCSVFCWSLYPLTFVCLWCFLHAVFKLCLLIKKYFKLGKFLLKIKLKVSKLKSIKHKILSLVVIPFSAHEGLISRGNTFVSSHLSPLFFIFFATLSPSIKSPHFIPVPFINQSPHYSFLTSSFTFTWKQRPDTQYDF
jgi:hypothetical protein